MHASSVASKIALCALLSLLSAQGKDITAVAAPVGSHVGKVDEAMGNAMVQFGLVRIGLGVGLRDALGHNLRIAFLVARVLAVRALHTGSVLEELSAESAAHDVVELLLHELVSVLLDDLFFALANGTLSTQAVGKGLRASGVLDEGHGQMYASNGFQREPVVNKNGARLRLR